MGGITFFVDAIYDVYNKAVPNAEEDQKLPEREVLDEVCQILLNVGCLREEGRFPSFRVCFIPPESKFLDAYIYAHVLLFNKPVGFNTREIHKLAPALNADMSYLIVDTSKRPFMATGILAAYTTWERIMTRELTSGNRMPRIPNILVNGPGELGACFGEIPFVNYHAGSCVFFRTDTFTSTLISDQLREGTTVPEKERLRLLYRILWHAGNYGHGGTVLIVPSEESCAEYIDMKYPLPGRYLFEIENRSGKHSEMMVEKETVTYADLIAKFTSVDGSVVLTKDLDLVGFGAETLVDKMENKQPDMRFIGYNDSEDSTKLFKDYGMRHRAGYRFCDTVEGSVAIIISQDGVIQACTKHDGKVVVYDNVALPMF